MSNTTISQRSCPEPGTVFQHTDGGLYRFITEALNADNKEPLYVYQHLWPFERLTWVRLRREWVSRFTEISPVEATRAMAGDREAAQAAVISAKTARRNGALARRAAEDAREEAREEWAEAHFGALRLTEADGTKVILSWLLRTEPGVEGEAGHFISRDATYEGAVDNFLEGRGVRISKEEFARLSALPQVST